MKVFIMYQREKHDLVVSRLTEPRKFIQVLTGPRQTGKTTLAHQATNELKCPSHYASADDTAVGDRIWIEQQWDIARLLIDENDSGSSAILILDEIQKIPGWSEVIKRLWDEDSYNQILIKVLLLGSSPLLIQKGLTESLAGRFETIPITHWSFQEMKAAFNFSLDEYMYFGGYPGAAGLIKDEERWKRYLLDSLIDTTLSKDILLMNRIDKPILLRRLFQLGCEYSGQILSYTKMLGQLQGVGNTTTLAHYLELLSGAGMLTGLQKYAGEGFRRRGSSPKLQILNTGLMSAVLSHDFNSARNERNYWGRLVESAVGAHIHNTAVGNNIQVYYWRDRNMEIDFVVKSGSDVIAIEVKSGARAVSLPGMEAFANAFNPKRKLLVGKQGIQLEDFLSKSISEWI